MDKCSSNEDTGAKVLAKEEGLRWDVHPLDLLSHDWEATSYDAGKEHNDYKR